MDVQVNAGQLVCAIAGQEISEVVEKLTGKFRVRTTEMLQQFVESTPSASRTFELENGLFVRLRELGRELIQWLLRGGSKITSRLHEVGCAVIVLG